MEQEAESEFQAVDDEIAPIIEGVENLDISPAEKEFRDVLIRCVNKVTSISLGKRFRDLQLAAKDLRDVLRDKQRFDAEVIRNLVLVILREGCTSGKPSTIEQCIDFINRLIEHGYIGGSSAPNYRIDNSLERTTEIVNLVCSGMRTQEDSVYLRVLQALLSLVKTSDSGVHGNAMLTSIRTVYSVYINAQTESVRTSARASLDQIMEVVFGNLEKDLSVPEPNPEEVSVSVKQGDQENAENDSFFVRDAYLLFRALSRLASTEDDPAASSSSNNTKSKLLALDLLLQIVKRYRAVLAGNDRFVHALRHHLAPVLVHNGMSIYMSVSSAALSIVDVLIAEPSLRPVLKYEIGTLLDTVVIRYINSPSVSVPRKRRSLETVRKLFASQKALVELFVNYDCDYHEQSIYESTMKQLCSVLETSQKSTVRTPGSTDSDEQKEVAAGAATGNVLVKLETLDTIATAMKSMREWSEPLESNDKDSYDKGAESRYGSVDSRDVMQSSEKLNIKTFDKGDEREAEHFESAQERKRQVGEAVALFNKKPTKGVQLLISRVLMNNEPERVAKFLTSFTGLDATAIGEYFGEGDPFAVSVMAAYTDLHDFSGVRFDDGIRQYLSKFRLPGEAQKIDRIMEKYASRYCECNPMTFASADTAYVLAYSVIMLNTDAHNPQVKNKMSKEAFIRNNRGINDGEDLETALLEELYDRIVSNEIKLSGTAKDKKSDEALQAALEQSDVKLSSERTKIFKAESELLLQRTKVEFEKRKASPQSYDYYRARNIHLARLMFNVSWEPVLAVASQHLSEAQASDEKQINTCIQIFQDSITIAVTFGMDTESLRFVEELMDVQKRELRVSAKHVQCMKTVVNMIAYEGESLQELYVSIVKSASMIELIRALGTGDKSCFLRDSNAILPNRNEENGSSLQPTTMSSAPESEGTAQQTSPVKGTSRRNSGKRVISVKAVEAVAEVPPALTMRLFEDTSGRSLAELVCLCGALADVAIEEMQEDEPRSFSLRKIVDITNQNMYSRTRYQWTKIWEMLGKFFENAIGHKNRIVSLYACEVLTNLASKFLEQDELSNYTFQKSFLSPFEKSFSMSTMNETRVQILSCMQRLVQSDSANIKSGWKSVFHVLSDCAETQSEELVRMGFGVLEKVFETCVGVLDDVFIVSIGGIVSYINNPTDIDIARRAVKILSEVCPRMIADGKAMSSVYPVTVEHEDQPVFTDANEAHNSAWFPVLLGLSVNVKSIWPDIVSEALQGLFSILEEYGGSFTPGLWTLIFRGVLTPIFDDVKLLTQGSRDAREERQLEPVARWAAGTGKEALMSLCKVILQHFSRTRSTFRDLLSIIFSWATGESESLNKDGMEAVRLVAMTGGKLYTRQEWDELVQSLSLAFNETIPYDLLRPPAELFSAKSAPTDLESLTTTPAALAGERPDAPEVQPADEEIRGSIVPPIQIDGGFGTNSETFDEQEPQGSSSMDADVPPKSMAGKQSFRVVRGKCVAQLDLISLVQDVVDEFYMKLTTQQILALVEQIWKSYEFAHKFNASVEQRFALWRTGFMNQVPNLIKQETNGMLASLRILMWLYADSYKDPKAKELVSVRLTSLFEERLGTFVELSSTSASEGEDHRELLALTPVVLFILSCFERLPEAEFAGLCERFYNIFFDLMDTDVREVRAAAVNLVRVRLSALHGYRTEGNQSYIPRSLLPKTVKESVLGISGDGGGLELLNGKLAVIPGIYGLRTEKLSTGETRVYVYGEAKIEVILSAIANMSEGVSVTIL
eukprot:CAMPEP_0113961046 /NCGR_PEP_ID=MMETSP0011_2-20120614/5075_1 /TAXON_ID=101924 /ORGANISM="Rhodosorus marinus" /LENGTH=1768 /DNA_ID=CAMNT_0000972611 /DNA_START=177 /DNA_END=5483 /DNA_ORIENTATION=+ /assembly_acc=CAM_ASM_000156